MRRFWRFLVNAPDCGLAPLPVQEGPLWLRAATWVRWQPYKLVIDWRWRRLIRQFGDAGVILGSTEEFMAHSYQRHREQDAINNGKRRPS